jgi:hypothetical protein
MLFIPSFIIKITLGWDESSLFRELNVWMKKSISEFSFRQKAFRVDAFSGIKELIYSN